MTRSVIQFRVSPEERERIAVSAAANKMTVSQFIRLKLLGPLESGAFTGPVCDEPVPAGDHKVSSRDECPYTAIQLSNRAQITVAGAQRHIDNGTWRSIL